MLPTIWEPFFGRGSQTIPTSHVSHALSIRVTENLTITDAEELRRELDLIRRRGYVVSYGELDAGVYAVGAPICNSLGRLEAGVTLVGPGSRWTEERLSRYVEETLAAARRISERLGYRPVDERDNIEPAGSGGEAVRLFDTRAGKEE